MRRDENGIAVPDFADPPYAVSCDEHNRMTLTSRKNGNHLDIEFVAHAANYHAKLANIVRRLAEWKNEVFIEDQPEFIYDIVNESEALWNEMKADK